ncbi:nucleotidyltransferase family protein [Campylobacter magnus]|uniref:nucleotidyltransferase family protein n=1 Tax=Campylobacter magnus TaxID=3026462 RepID=UPI00235F0501|nr:nucleotidyltransferase family protein [Campylobacter magnus]MDD0855219.1 nucleotidyltransferase family protein [Campylobacter magnus]
MYKIDEIKINQNASIKEALEVIDKGAIKVAVVLSDDGLLLGMLNDGDIRRALLKGMSLGDSIAGIINKHPVVANINDTKERILELANEKKLHQIPIISNGKLIGIQDIREFLAPKNKPNKVILMVGGLGTRLRPLTNDVPKPMLDVGNKPILHTIVENFAKYGYTDIIMCVNYKSEIIKEYFGNGDKFGVKIEYVLESKRMGTAGALSLLKERPKDDFFVMNGDLLTNVNFEYLHEYHKDSNALASICIRKYEMQVPYGVVNVRANKVTSIEEKPTQSFFVSAGIYMFSPIVLDFIPNGVFYDMPTLFSELLKHDFPIHPFPIREYWLDIGRMDEYRRANDEYEGVFGL